jgi:signal transduction histidine kinase
VFDDGAGVLEALVSSGAPDVLVLDWRMPDVTGAEVCRFIRGMKNLVELPILVLTATTDIDSLLEGLEVGANDFVRWPISAAELRARVANLIRTAALHSRLLELEGRLRLEADFRERFMGMLAHDLRQPLNSISMAANALLQSNTQEPNANFVRMQLRAAARMQRMIAELLDFTSNRPESGMPLQRQWVDFAVVARACLEELRAANPERVFHMSVDGECSGSWDPDRLLQICGNLLSNAVEHSSDASPILVAIDSSPEHVKLDVSNDGPTIPSALLETIFQPFRRGRASRRASGVGLGLHIVHEIVRAHSGTITVNSEAGATTFCVTLPRNLNGALS